MSLNGRSSNSASLVAFLTACAIWPSLQLATTASELPSATGASSAGQSKSGAGSKTSKAGGPRSNYSGEPVLSGDISGCKLTVCISTNDKETGTPIAAHHWWGSSENSRHFYHNLTPGKKYYLHVLVEPPSNSRVMLGVFSVAGPFKFASSGLQALDSRPQYWKVSRSGFGRDYQTPAVANGSEDYLRQCPVIKRLDVYAQTLMDPVGKEGYNGYVFFSTAIVPQGGGKHKK
jgi:hypothetical protein